MKRFDHAGKGDMNTVAQYSTISLAKANLSRIGPDENANTVCHSGLAFFLKSIP